MKKIKGLNDIMPMIVIIQTNLQWRKVVWLTKQFIILHNLTI